MKPAPATVHPELRELAGKMPALPISRRSIGLIRIFTKIMLRGAKMPAGLRVWNQSIPSQDGTARIRLRIYQPQRNATAGPALLWMHGGGYVIGLPEMDDGYIVSLIQATGALVVSVDYRLAPGAAFPAPLADCYSALLWLAEQAGALGIDPGRIAIGGNSAGAGLAAALAQIAHDRAQVRPVFQLLVYPMLDDRTAARAEIDPRGHLAWNNACNAFGWESYLKQPPGGTQAPAGSVPARRADLTGLPPAWIGVGSIDLFHDEDVAYARRLQQAGVPCELVVVPGAFHGFDAAAPQAQIVKEFRRSQIAALKKYLG